MESGGHLSPHDKDWKAEKGQKKTPSQEKKDMNSGPGGLRNRLAANSGEKVPVLQKACNIATQRMKPIHTKKKRLGKPDRCQFGVAYKWGILRMSARERARERIVSFCLGATRSMGEKGEVYLGKANSPKKTLNKAHQKSIRERGGSSAVRWRPSKGLCRIQFKKSRGKKTVKQKWREVTSKRRNQTQIRSNRESAPFEKEFRLTKDTIKLKSVHLVSFSVGREGRLSGEGYGRFMPELAPISPKAKAQRPLGR